MGKCILAGHPPAEGIRFQTGSYVGDGHSGQAYRRSITFTFPPKLVILMLKNTYTLGQSALGFVWYPGITGLSGNGSGCSFSMSGNTLSFGTGGTNDIASYAQYGFNNSGSTYCWMAIG